MAENKNQTERSFVERVIDDQELMRLWGELHAEWDQIEQFIYMVFDSLMDEDSWSTHAIFYSQRSHAARREMVEELAKVVAQHRGLIDLDRFKKVIKRVKARSGTRHKLTHGYWVELNDKGIHRASKMANRLEEIKNIAGLHSKATLRQRIAEFRETRQELGRLAMELSLAKHNRRLAAMGHPPIVLSPSRNKPQSE